MTILLEIQQTKYKNDQPIILALCLMPYYALKIMLVSLHSE